MKISRRSFIQQSAIGTGSILLPFNGLQAFSTLKEKDHFFLQIFVRGGVDSSYLFDSRDLIFTEKNIMQNFLEQSPIKWVDSNNRIIKASPLVKPLEKYKNDFSILKGVHMSSSFDGHDQNTNLFFTGNAFGGEVFLPSLHKKQVAPIGSIQLGNLFYDKTNQEELLNLTTQSLKMIVEQIKKQGPLIQENLVFKNLLNTYTLASGEMGPMGKGSKQLLSALNGSPKINQSLLKIKTELLNQNGLKNDLNAICQIFANKISNSCTLILDYTASQIDCHDLSAAKKHPQYVKKIINDLIEVIQFLKNTAYKKSNLLDHTTFCYASEFSRTMKQMSKLVSKTGTDHNPLNNTILLGGKGIKSNMIIGDTDFQDYDEKLSGAHLSRDRNALSIMGKPFDFKNFTTIDGYLPEKYNIKDYLTIGSVINTVLSLFKADNSNFHKKEDYIFPVLQNLLK